MGAWVFGGVVLTLAGVVFLWMGWAGLAERLPMNSVAGIRVAATMRSEAAWRAAHRASGWWVAAAGVVPLVAGIAILATGGSAEFLAGIAAAWLIVFGIVASVVAVRAANRVADLPPKDEPPAR